MSHSYLRTYASKAYWVDLFKSFAAAVQTRKFWWELVLMTIGIFIGAAAVYYFLMPSHIIVGTISGLSIVINTVLHGTR
jgi:uncharacterized membrane-anchored protein YitT (DUF2179 family)